MCALLLSDASFQPLLAIKEEVISRAGSEQGEEEMEVDSADEQEEERRGGQISKTKNMGSTFSTLSSLGSLKPGNVEKLNPFLVTGNWSVVQLTCIVEKKKNTLLWLVTGKGNEFYCFNTFETNPKSNFRIKPYLFLLLRMSCNPGRLSCTALA